MPSVFARAGQSPTQSWPRPLNPAWWLGLEAIGTDRTKRGGQWVSKGQAEWNEFQRASMYHFMLKRKARENHATLGHSLAARFLPGTPVTHATIKQRRAFGGRRVVETAPSQEMLEAMGGLSGYDPATSRGLTTRGGPRR